MILIAEMLLFSQAPIATALTTGPSFRIYNERKENLELLLPIISYFQCGKSLFLSYDQHMETLLMCPTHGKSLFSLTYMLKITYCLFLLVFLPSFLQNPVKVVTSS
jgi:hypothetical protein